MKKRKLTAEQQAASEARRAAFKELCGKIARMTKEERAEFSARIPSYVTVEGRSLSAHNCMLIAYQRESATMLGGFRQWIQQGRCVRKGERGISIYIPRGGGASGEGQASEGDAGEAANRPSFVVGTVFDVSQTDELERAAAEEQEGETES